MRLINLYSVVRVSFGLVFVLSLSGRPCFAHNMTIEVKPARNIEAMNTEAFPQFIAIVKVDGQRASESGLSWYVSPDNGGLSVSGVSSTDACGVATALVSGSGTMTGFYLVFCKWTDSFDPNHTHSGNAGITLRNDPCSSITPSTALACSADHIRAARCSITVKYLLSDPPRQARRLEMEVNAAVGIWNNATAQIKFVRDDETDTPTIEVVDRCFPNATYDAATVCVPADPQATPLIKFNVYRMAGNCADYMAGFCDYDWTTDNEANQNTAVHELGHALSLVEESGDYKAMLMYKNTQNWFDCFVTTPSSLEVQRINNLYPGTP